MKLTEDHVQVATSSLKSRGITPRRVQSDQTTITIWMGGQDKLTIDRIDESIQLKGRRSIRFPVDPSVFEDLNTLAKRVGRVLNVGQNSAKIESLRTPGRSGNDFQVVTETDEKERKQDNIERSKNQEGLSMEDVLEEFDQKMNEQEESVVYSCAVCNERLKQKVYEADGDEYCEEHAPEDSNERKLLTETT